MTDRTWNTDIEKAPWGNDLEFVITGKIEHDGHIHTAWDTVSLITPDRWRVAGAHTVKQEPESPWRPMSEAPRDGTIIIARIDEPEEDLYILVHTKMGEPITKWYQVGRDDLFNYEDDFSGWHEFPYPKLPEVPQ